VDALNGPLEAVEWVGDERGYLKILDQTRLPASVEVIECRDLETVREAIRSLRVRGAPAIGIAGAYGLIVGLQADAGLPGEDVRERVARTSRALRACRPTAVNLFAYLDRLESVAAVPGAASDSGLPARLFAEARRIDAENRDACEAMARHGAALIEDGWGVITHCNTGGLATAGIGTALGVLIRAHEDGKRLRVFADETRPLLQGARLTTLELRRAGVDVTLICDSAAARVLHERRADAVFLGADRIASNGDVANKIGTYSLAVNAAAHGIPFFVVAPTSTIDAALENGDAIPIEERRPDEVATWQGEPIAPPEVAVYNPAFDVTPHRYVSAIVTERGVLRPPFRESIAAALEPART
jgi:methylthioribose-1-phosphate isomerase